LLVLNDTVFTWFVGNLLLIFHLLRYIDRITHVTTGRQADGQGVLRPPGGLRQTHAPARACAWLRGYPFVFFRLGVSFCFFLTLCG
jgi:hypothetical protein